MDDWIFQAMVELYVRFTPGTQLHIYLETVYIFSYMMKGVGLSSCGTGFICITSLAGFWLQMVV
jgi:hypothetical protein